MIYLITGLMASGKSTVAEMLAAQLNKAVHLRGDVFRKMIVSGRADMNDAPSQEALDQLDLRYRLTATAAKTYHQAGFDVVVQDNYYGENLPHMLELLSPEFVFTVVLCPDAETIKAREAGRTKTGYAGFSADSLYRDFMDTTPRIGLWLDNSRETPVETVSRILAGASREQYMEAVNVGARKPLNGSIQLCEYDAKWPRLFVQDEKRIRDALGGKALLVKHVGSTSVPGLCAKPIIDILLTVADSVDEDAYVPALEAAGYTLRIREPDWFEHRMFKGPDTDINLHVFSAGASEIEQMLLFRDWLREHADERELYAKAKRELARRTWKHIQDYADAKTEVVCEIMGRAHKKAVADEEGR